MTVEPQMAALETDRYRYIIGIDLGTTNSAVSYVDLAEQTTLAPGTPPILHIFDVPQLIAPGTIGSRPVLPSFLYLPGDYDLPAGSTDLPWTTDHDYLVGEGARVPGRLVASAKRSGSILRGRPSSKSRWVAGSMWNEGWLADST